MITWDAVHVSSLNNGLDLVVVIAISGLIHRRHPTPFFRAWLKAYGAILFLWVAEFVTTFSGRSLPIDLAEFVLASWTAFHLYLTAQELGDARSCWPPLRWLIASLALGAGVARIAGVPYQVACLPPFLGYMGAYGWLGGVLVRAHGDRSKLLGRLTGLPILAFVAWTLFAYPALQFHQLVWVGFLVAGLLQLAIGCSMSILLLERTGQELTRKNQQLEASDRWKDEVLGIVSHELRTPVSAIRSAVHLLTSERSERLSQQQSEFVGMIGTSAAQLGLLVDDVFDLARMQSGNLTYEYLPSDLVEVAERVLYGLAPLFEHKGVRLILREGEASLPVLLDPGRIAQVLKNLLSNALNHTPEGGEVHLALSQDRHDALIDVTDTGSGIAAEHLPAIFDKFYRVDNLANRRSKGLGLGLSLTKGIIEQGHAGTITVESQPGAGTTFHVRLPLDGPGVVRPLELTRSYV